MAESLEPSYDPEQTIVVWNFPEDVGEDELTIHFEKKKNGGGDVAKVVVDGSVAFVIFDLPEGQRFLYSILNRILKRLFEYRHASYFMFRFHLVLSQTANVI